MLHFNYSRVLVIGLVVLTMSGFDDAPAQAPKPSRTVKVAAVQITGYDKGDLPREGYDPTTAILPYIDRAAKDHAQLVVFPEYVLGRIQVPGPVTKKIAASAARNSIYVIVGCWEEFDDGTYANTALIFDRAG